MKAEIATSIDKHVDNDEPIPEPHQKKQKTSKKKLGGGGKEDDVELGGKEKTAEAVKKEANSKFDIDLASVRSLNVRMVKELGEVDLIEKQLAARVRWGTGPLDFLKQEHGKWKNIAAEVNDEWVNGKMWKQSVDGNNDTAAEIEQKATRFATFTIEKEAAYKEEFVQGVLTEFATVKK